jgi:isopentenyl diphosphate isomerase/L-lactate dehydrogenase-like FMN-dependent dehydrogenase
VAGNFVVKSVLNPTDARRAVERGADGIVISNHGGRGMDSSVATIDALPGSPPKWAGDDDHARQRSPSR